LEITSPTLPVRQSPRKRSLGWLGNQRERQTTVTLTLMALPGIVLLFVFAYLPMGGLVIAFKNYRFADGLFGSAWVGFDNFRFLFGADAALRVTRNTILMNSLFIITGTLASLLIAILMNEVYTSWTSKYYQTLLFFPHFISWVIVSYFVFGFLNGDTGIANKFLTSIGAQSIGWYREPGYWPAILTITHLWNGVGFGSIVYLAGILGIDTAYFEAAKIDGANKWQQIRYIMLPMLLPLVIILVLLSIGRIFNADFGLFYFVPRNTPQLYSTTDVIDTFVYRSLVQLGDISMAAAAGLYQSVVGFVLVVVANWVVRKINRDYSLF
jgi:putative aldouronate transport system permease protein